MSYFESDDFKQLHAANKLAMMMWKKKHDTLLAKQKADEEFKRASRRRDLATKAFVAAATGHFDACARVAHYERLAQQQGQIIALTESITP